MKYFLIAYGITVFLLLSSCHGSKDGNGLGEPADERALTGREGEMILSRSQFETMGMKIGDPAPIMFSNAINANGYVTAKPSGSARVSTMISGRVTKIYHSPGDLIKKGQALFTLEGNEIIGLQQAYGEAYHQLKVLQKDYDRLRTLSEGNVVSQKDFLKSESEYKSMMARVDGLKARLNIIQIDPAKVESGNLIPQIDVVSPIAGTIIRQQMVLGQFVEPQETLLELIDHQKMQLSLQIFEKDLGDIAIGQKVLFYRPDNPEREFEARLSHIGKSIDPETRVVQCLAQIAVPDQGAFMNNLFVETRIITCQREAPAIPEASMIKEADRTYVLVLQDENQAQMIFKKIPIRTGVTRQGFTEVLEEGVQNILIEGAYNLWGEE